VKRLGAGLAVLALLVSASHASGAPPQDSPQAQTLELTCDGGVAFTVVTIEQNAAVAAQVVAGVDARVFLLTQAEVDGEVVFSIPGPANADKTAVTGCTSPTFPGVVVGGFLVP
jgi:hypothetical protein